MTNLRAGAATVAGDERIRLFCALQLADQTVECLHGWAWRELAGAGRIVPAESLHVTLAFLGHRPVAEIPAIVRELRAAAAASSPVELRVQRYRETRSVGMVVLDDVGGAASALAGDLQARLERLGAYQREQRAWLPHITVLRVRSRAGGVIRAPNMCSIHAVRSALYRSNLGAGGARYDIVETGALGGQE